MAEYNIEFAEKLAEIAGLVVADGLSDFNAIQTVLYLSLLSTEISLKSMLERAGNPVAEIRARSHRLADLLTDLGRCEVEVEVTPGKRMYIPASCLRSIPLKHDGAKSTVGRVIDAEKQQRVSTYPNQIRYGEVLHHYPPEAVAQMAAEVVAFAHQHWQSIRVK